jgi:uncharacterized damage-inducible protein DinB
VQPRRIGATILGMNSTAELYDYATAVPASRDFFNRSTSVLEESDSQFRPRDGMMTVAQHVAHAAQTIEWFVDGATRPEGFDLHFEEQARALAEVRSLKEARHRLENAFLQAADFLRSKTPEELARPLPPGPIMGGRPVFEVIGAMVEHTAHHRGALAVYTRLLGKVPPMPYGG